MKVLTYTSLFPNSAQADLGVFIYQRMAHFGRRDSNQVVVVAPLPYAPSWIKHPRWKKWTRIPELENIGDLPVHHCRYPMLPRVSLPFQAGLMFLGSLALVRQLHKQHQFDVIDAHFVYPDGVAAIWLGKFLGLPVVLSARGTDINDYPKYWFVRSQIRRALRSASGTIAVCKSLGNVMKQLAGPALEVAEIGNGVDTSRFFPVERATARRELGLPETAPVVVAVGALIPRKGYQFLIPAFAQVLQQFPEAQLHIIGQGESHGQLQRTIAELRLSKAVHLAGPCPNARLRLWYSAADVSCLASSREGWPNVLLESLACGTPVVATGIWGSPEVITSPKLGILMDQNTDAIAAGLKAALAQEWDRDWIAAHARQREWNQVAKEVEDYLHSVIARESGSFSGDRNSTAK